MAGGEGNGPVADFAPDLILVDKKPLGVGNEIVAALFTAGPAFGEQEGEQAYNAVVKVDYNF